MAGVNQPAAFTFDQAQAMFLGSLDFLPKGIVLVAFLDEIPQVQERGRKDLGFTCFDCRVEQIVGLGEQVPSGRRFTLELAQQLFDADIGERHILPKIVKSIVDDQSFKLLGQARGHHSRPASGSVARMIGSALGMTAVKSATRPALGRRVFTGFSTLPGNTTIMAASHIGFGPFLLRSIGSVLFHGFSSVTE